jgi:hypothetical protein
LKSRERLGSWICRIAVVVACMGVAVIGCGGGDGGSDDDELTGPVEPGFFIGETSQGEPFSIAVSSIRSVFVSCGGPQFGIFTRFDPPEPVAVDGSFAVNVVTGSRFLGVSGIFQSQERVRGTISGDPFCAGRFRARRCHPPDPACLDNDGDTIPDGVDPDGGRLPTPTPTVTVTPTSTAPTPTPTPGGPTSTALSPTPVATPEEFCGNGVIDEDEGEECDGENLGGETCESLGNEGGGTLRCDECSFDEDDCEFE